jgi:hypothetical protein
MRSLPTPTRPQVRLRVVSIELLCTAMFSEALKAHPHNELRGRMIACFFKSLTVRLVTLAAAAPVPPAECGGQAGPTRAAACGARLPTAGPLLSEGPQTGSPLCSMRARDCAPCIPINVENDPCWWYGRRRR